MRSDTVMTPARTYELALTLSAMGLYEEAIVALRAVAAHMPDCAPAWFRLAELLRLAGEDEEARMAEAHAARGIDNWPPAFDPRTPTEIGAAEKDLRERVGEIAEPHERLRALHAQLRANETDAAALRLLARLEWKDGELMAARALLERAVKLAPAYQGARADLAQLYRSLSEDARAAMETACLLAQAPDNIAYRALHADALFAIGDVASSISLMEALIGEAPANARFRCVYAQALHFAGRREESAREFRACLKLQPGMGAAYWGLAELRGNFLSADDISAMRQYLSEPREDLSDTLLMQYARGEALERVGDYSGSFAAYEGGAALLRAIASSKGEIYDTARDAEKVRRRRAAFTRSMLDAFPARPATSDPIPLFVLGMPRAGSTLVEQILASHSLVEATMELPVLGAVVRDLGRSRLLVEPDAYPECVAQLGAAELAALGKRYIDEAAAYRRLKRPYFVDKKPWNWLEAGLIHLILPHAKIIDVRREPMAACFAMYKHMLADDGTFPYELNDLAHCYMQYAALMSHYDAVMPGRIHFLSYERLVEDTEGEIRRMLDYCGLPFEDACVRFWETSRAITTPSAEQVRRPIFREGLQQWRNFEQWLGALKEALKQAEAEAAAISQPVGYESALTLSAMGMYETAIEELRAVTEETPANPDAWRNLSELLRWAGEDGAADKAEDAARQWTDRSPNWIAARDARKSSEIESAEQRLAERFFGMDREGEMEMLREHLLEHPTDAAATHLLSRLEWENDNQSEARALLERTLQLAPFHHRARAELALMFMRRNSFAPALEQAQILVRQMPADANYRAIYSDTLQCVGEFASALAVTEELLRDHPRHARFWYGYGLLLHYVGRRDESARAFRSCLEISPTMGEAWWGLADLKGRYLTETDIPVMRSSLSVQTLDSSDRMYLYYALAHTLERAGDYAASFAAYQQGARLFRGFFLARAEAYDEEEFVARVRNTKRVYSAANLAERLAPPEASVAETPIFIVGMPRAGSTLVEQILASHSQVEATRELPTMTDLIRDLNRSRRAVASDAYPDCVLEMTPEQLASLGEKYLCDARPYRKSDRPIFVDKRPWNWLEAGLIRLILPQAKIIDIRREPMAACFSMFKQVLTNGADFTYDLHDLGRYYTEYVGLMEHWRSVMPDGIHFVQYERLVENTEAEIRRLLEFCGLPFEENCLRFWETERAISTPSAEQVRRPIFRDAIEQWRNYEPWLGPLKDALAQPARA